MKHTLTCLLLAAASCTVGAETIYRCGKGGTEYSQTPCVSGSAIDVTDDRSDAQRAEARRVAAQDRQLATQMERERLSREAAIRPAGAATLTAKTAAVPTAVIEPRHPRKTRIVRVKVASGRR